MIGSGDSDHAVPPSLEAAHTYGPLNALASLTNEEFRACCTECVDGGNSEIERRHDERCEEAVTWQA